MEKANWTKFRTKANFDLPINSFFDIDELSQYINKVIIDAATSSIPITKPMYGKISVPWWNGPCRVAVKKKKCAFRRYLRSPTLQNHIFYKKANSEAKQIVKQSKKTS